MKETIFKEQTNKKTTNKKKPNQTTTTTTKNPDNHQQKKPSSIIMVKLAHFGSDAERRIGCIMLHHTVHQPAFGSKTDVIAPLTSLGVNPRQVRNRLCVVVNISSLLLARRRHLQGSGAGLCTLLIHMDSTREEWGYRPWRSLTLE